MAKKKKKRKGRKGTDFTAGFTPAEVKEPRSDAVEAPRWDGEKNDQKEDENIAIEPILVPIPQADIPFPLKVCEFATSDGLLNSQDGIVIDVTGFYVPPLQIHSGRRWTPSLSAGFRGPTVICINWDEIQCLSRDHWRAMAQDVWSCLFTAPVTIMTQENDPRGAVVAMCLLGNFPSKPVCKDPVDWYCSNVDSLALLELDADDLQYVVDMTDQDRGVLNKAQRMDLSEEDYE